MFKNTVIYYKIIYKTKNCEYEQGYETDDVEEIKTMFMDMKVNRVLQYAVIQRLIYEVDPTGKRKLLDTIVIGNYYL